MQEYKVYVPPRTREDCSSGSYKRLTKGGWVFSARDPYTTRPPIAELELATVRIRLMLAGPAVTELQVEIEKDTEGLGLPEVFAEAFSQGLSKVPPEELVGLIGLLVKDAREYGRALGKRQLQDKLRNLLDIR